MFFYDLFFIVINRFHRNDRFYNIFSAWLLIGGICLFLVELLYNSIDLKNLFLVIALFLLSFTRFWGLENLYTIVFSVLNITILFPTVMNYKILLQGGKHDVDLAFAGIFAVIIAIILIIYAFYSMIKTQLQKN